MSTHRNDWRRTIALFALTGLVESLAFGHLGAFTPLFLEELRVPHHAVPFWTGLLSALGFVIGLPLLPFWPVLADRYGRKLIIIRSSVVGALMFALAAASRDVWMLAGARFLSGFVLGNTGIMLAVQAEITPRERLGASMAIINTGSPIGMTVGPYLGGWIIERASIRALLFLDAALTALVALLLVVFLREEPRAPAPRQSAWAGVRAALRAIARTPTVVALFLASFLMALGLSATMPYVPLLIQRLYTGMDVAGVIGIVLTVGGIAMAAATPVWGRLGDRKGHLSMLRLCALAVATTMLGLAMAGGVWSAGLWRAAQGIFMGGLGALTMALLALYTPPDRRAAVLTLSLLPSQLAWFLGPLLGALLAWWDLRAVFWAAALFLLAGWAASLRLPVVALEGARADADR